MFSYADKLHQRGFTLVELTVVIVLLSILAAVAFPRLDGLGPYQDANLRNSILSSLKLAQKTALAQHAASVYWVAERQADDRWMFRLLLDTDTTDSNVPADVSPPALSNAFESDSNLNFTVSLSAGGSLTGALSANQNLVIMYNQLGDMVQVKRDVTLTTAADFPAPQSSTDAVNSSLQLNDSRGNFCLSLTGYTYAGTCRP